MRLRKRHAWGAVLIGLFALPVLKPGGIPAIEDPAAGTVTWAASITDIGPRLWPSARDGGPDDPRARALEQQLARLWERHLQLVGRMRELVALDGALAGALEETPLERMPRALLTRVLRAHDAVPTRRSILIDRGAADGLRPGLPVVMGDVYLGRVAVVRSRSALVKLVTDPTARVEVFVRTSNGTMARGWVEGTRASDERLPIRFVRLREGQGVVEPGAPVVTANFDERVPAHLLVGTVATVSDPDLDRMPTLEMRPALDLDRATEAIVLLPAAPAAPPR